MLSRGSMPHKLTGRQRWFFFLAMWGLPFTVTCPSADVTVRCCTRTARLHPLSARNLETNVTDRVAYHSLFRFYAVHVYAFLLLFFCVPSVPSCFSSPDTDGTAIITVPSVPSRFRETDTVYSLILVNFLLRTELGLFLFKIYFCLE